MFDISALFISTAMAAETAASTVTDAASAVAPGASLTGEPSSWIRFLPLALIFLVFYFLLIRPQQKKLDEQASLIKALKKGDKVITSGGIVGTISKLENDSYVMVEIAKDVQIKVARTAISGLTKED